MMIRNGWTALTVGLPLMLAVSVTNSDARAYRYWDEDELWQAADVVVVASAGPTQQPSLTAKPGGVVMVTTTLTVRRVLKGGVPTGTIEFSHQEYADPDYVPQFVVDGGPPVIDFRNGQRFPLLLFLKHDQGDLYEPASGTNEPSPSVQMIVPYQQDSPVGSTRAEVVPKPEALPPHKAAKSSLPL